MTLIHLLRLRNYRSFEYNFISPWDDGPGRMPGLHLNYKVNVVADGYIPYKYWTRLGFSFRWGLPLVNQLYRELDPCREEDLL